MTRLFLLSLIFTSSFVHAADNYRFGNTTIAVGDSAENLVAVAGAPSHKETIGTNRPGFTGQRWEYRQDGKSVDFLIAAGKIQGIDGVSNAPAGLAASAKTGTIDMSQAEMCRQNCGTN